MEASLLCFSSVFLIVLRVFLLLFYQITEALQQQTQGFRNEKFHIPVIFYADDGLLLANSHQDATSRAAALFNDTTLVHFHHILKGRKKQTSLDRYLLKRPANEESKESASTKLEFMEVRENSRKCHS